MLKLHSSTTSPFGRKAKVAAHFTGFTDKMQVLSADTMDPADPLRKDNPLAVYNPAWDARRLWLTKFVEQQRKVRLEGIARDGEDVSELARRMGLSSFFYEVRLLPARTQLK